MRCLFCGGFECHLPLELFNVFVAFDDVAKLDEVFVRAITIVLIENREVAPRREACERASFGSVSFG